MAVLAEKLVRELVKSFTNFYPVRMGLRKMRKKEQKPGKGQAYLLVPFSLPGMIMGICIG